MLTVFDNGIGYPLVYDNYYIRELASGLNEIIFEVNVRDELYQHIAEENVVRDRDQQEYLIKQIDAGPTTAKVVAQINIDDWKGAMHLDYSNNSDTVRNTIAGVAPQGWSVVDRSQRTIRRTIPTSDTTQDYNVTSWEIVTDCCETYSVRVQVDTLNKILYIVNPDLYTNLGAFAARDLNLKKLNYKGKSDNFVTRLYAVGADGMTFASINDGKPYVENYTYSQKVISAYWKDERYTDKQSLLDDATEKLAEMAKPARSYDCEVLDLAKTNPEIYNFEDFSLFNVITLVDDIRQERLDYQIVEKWDYPYYPVKNKIVLSSVTPNLQSVVTQIVNAINNPVSVFSQKLQSAVLTTTALITGNRGGYLILKDSDEDGFPDELLIMDTDSIETATKVWRWNQAGLGYSNTGYEGQYILGMNMLGQINADMITAGHINGEIIEAGSIEISAMSENAKQSLAASHSYIVDNPTSLLTNWEWRPVAEGLVSIETIGGVDCLALDGSGLGAYDSAYYAQIKTSLFEKQTVTLHYKFMVDGAVSVNQRQWFIYYLSKAGTYELNWNMIDESLEANQWYSVDFTWETLGTISKDYACRFGIYMFPGVKQYIKELTITTTTDSYAQASMTVTEEGLALLAEQVDENNQHSYIPYDSMTNASRWKQFYTSPNVPVTHETITVDGVTKDAICFDGSGLNDWNRIDVLADIMQQPHLTLKFKYRFASDFTPDATHSLACVMYYNESLDDWYSILLTQIVGGTTYTAATEYLSSYTGVPTHTADYYVKPSRFSVFVWPGAKLYIYDLELYSTEQQYKKASLSYTADGLDSVVQAGSVISQINQSAEQVTIKADKINLTGALSLNGDFHCYDQTDNTNYAFLDDGNLSFFYQGTNVFTIASTPLLGNKAGIFYGDVEDPASMANYTYITQDDVTSPKFYAHTDGRYSTYAFPLVVEGDARVTELDCDIFRAYGTSNGSSSICGNVNFTNYGQGTSEVRFLSTVYNANGGVVFVSDKRKKKNIKDLVIDKARSFIMALKPRKFKFKEGTSGRDHHGFIAQEVKAVMPEDWGLYVEHEPLNDEDETFIGLRYDEFIADMVAVIQDQEKRIEALERSIHDLTDNKS